MNKKQFKYAMVRGLGRCYYAIKDSPEKYKDLVLWGAFNNFPYDPQCEGSRAVYMYNLMKCYNDPEYFLTPLIVKFLSFKCGNTLQYTLITDILACFALDGNETALKVMWDKYIQLYYALPEREKRSKHDGSSVSLFVALCMALSYNFKNYSRIACDIGNLYLKNPFYEELDFSWLYFYNAKYEKRLKRLKSPQIQRYIIVNQNIDRDFYVTKEENGSIAASMESWLLSEAEELKKYENFTPCQFENLLVNLKITYDSMTLDSWHSIHSDFHNMFSNKYVKNKPPKHLLKVLYETTLCSYCREYTLLQMSKYKLLTNEILEECLYDSNEDIVRFAKKKLQR